MATEFNSGGALEKDEVTGGAINPPARVGDVRHWSTIVILAMLAMVVAIGLIFSVRDATTTASDATPGVTTGISADPSPSNPAPARSPQGQGESNSTR
jgi:hypothetical protein